MRKQGPFSFAAALATLYIQGFCCQFYYLQVVPHPGILELRTMKDLFCSAANNMFTASL